MWTTKTAMFASPCRRCGGKIKVGQRFRYGRLPGMKSGVGYHLKADCPSEDATKKVEVADATDPVSPAKADPLSPEERATLELLLARSAAATE